MDTRKLIKFGNNSYVISLPPQWLKKSKLSKGDELLVTETDDNLLISPLPVQSAEIKSRPIFIEAGDKSLHALKTEIVSAYLTNYDIISVFSKTSLSLAVEIKAILQNLAGMEILEQTNTKIVAKDLIDERELSIESLIRRIDVILKSMLIDLIDNISTSPSKIPFDSIYQRDQDVNRLVYLTFRVIRKALTDASLRTQLGMNVLELFSSQFVVMRLEKIGDFTKRMARRIHTNKIDAVVLNKIKEIIKSTFESYNSVMSSFYKRDKKLAMQIELGKKKSIKKCNELRTKYACSDFPEVIDNLKNMNVSLSYIARAVLNAD